MKATEVLLVVLFLWKIGNTRQWAWLVQRKSLFAVNQSPACEKAQNYKGDMLFLRYSASGKGLRNGRQDVTAFTLATTWFMMGF